MMSHGHFLERLSQYNLVVMIISFTCKNSCDGIITDRISLLVRELLEIFKQVTSQVKYRVDGYRVLSNT